MDSILATKVANVCDGSIEWVYYPWPLMLAGLIVTTLAALAVLAIVGFIVIAILAE
tara:strand:+ start:411 stop:578 length:168 start_codon:yes stop_codon:yes gene_type:complete